MDFAVLAAHKVRIKESGKSDKYLDRSGELKRVWSIDVMEISRKSDRIIWAWNAYFYSLWHQHNLRQVHIFTPYKNNSICKTCIFYSLWHQHNLQAVHIFTIYDTNTIWKTALFYALWQNKICRPCIFLLLKAQFARHYYFYYLWHQHNMRDVQ